ncbi:MAG: DNA polymerase IV, partial [Spirochaetes bacterium]|nr:DNA polymerase IV [Spirochaetota bacterium]
MTKKIIHIDMDAFYASVEQRDNPSLKGKPIIVGGMPDERGVVSTASYEARKYGIKSAMATKRAVTLCPHLIILKPNFQKYKNVSIKLIEFYKEYTDLVEPLSLDECYLDVTTNKHKIQTATEIAIILKEKIKRELNLTASVGLAPNKFLAKIASDINKPDGLFVIKPHQIDD